MSFFGAADPKSDGGAPRPFVKHHSNLTEEAALRRREEEAVADQKQKRENAINQIRHAADPETAIYLEKLRHYEAGMVSSDPFIVQEAVGGFRLLLKEIQNLSAGEVSRICGVRLKLLEFLSSVADESLLIEVLGTCSVLFAASASQGELGAPIATETAMPRIHDLFGSSSTGIKEKSLSLIGILAAKAISARDTFLRLGTLARVISIVNDGHSNQKTVRTALNTMASLCSGRPGPSFALVSDAIATAEAHTRFLDIETQENAFRALSHLSDGYDDAPKLMMLKLGLHKRLLHVLQTSNERELLILALRTTGNLFLGSEKVCHHALQTGLLDRLSALVANDKPSRIRKEALWVCSNILDSGSAYIHSATSRGLLSAILNRANDTKAAIRHQVNCCIACAMAGAASSSQMEKLVDWVDRVAECLESSDDFLIWKALAAVNNYLSFKKPMSSNFGRGIFQNNFEAQIERCKLEDRINALQDHINGHIAEKAADILSRYFGYVPVDIEASGPAAKLATSTSKTPAAAALLGVRSRDERVQFESLAFWNSRQDLLGPDCEGILTQETFQDLKSLLKSTCSLRVREQATRLVSTLASKRPQSILPVAITELLNILKDHESPISLQRMASAAVYSLCLFGLGELASLDAAGTCSSLIFSDDKELVVNSLYSLSYLTHGDTEQIKRLIATPQVCECLASLLKPSNDLDLLIPALRTVGNLLTMHDDAASLRVTRSCLSAIVALLSHQNADISTDSIWACENILLGCVEQLDAFFFANGLPALMQCCGDSRHIIRKAALNSVAKSILCSPSSHLRQFSSETCVGSLVGALSSSLPTKLTKNVLNALERLLDRVATAPATVEHMGGLPKIETLWAHKDAEIAMVAGNILVKFFDYETDSGE